MIAGGYHCAQALSDVKNSYLACAGAGYMRGYQEYGEQSYVENIWNSAESYRKARQYRLAIPKYRQFLELDSKSRQQQTMIYLGEMYFELDMLDPASEALEEVLRRFPGAGLSYYASLLLSYVYMEKHEWDKAEMLLKQNLSGVLGPNAAEYRDSLFALGRMYYKRQRFEDAILRLEDATALHPEAIQTPEAHYLIALSYLQGEAGDPLSPQEPVLPSVRTRITMLKKEARAAALLHLNESQKQLIARQNEVNLTEAEQKMLRNIYFAVGNVLLDLGPEFYDDAVRAFNVAATRYQNIPESLDAMIQIARIYRAQGRREEAVAVIDLAKVLLERLTAAGAFPPERRFTSREWDDLLTWQRNL